MKPKNQRWHSVAYRWFLDTRTIAFEFLERGRKHPCLGHVVADGEGIRSVVKEFTDEAIKQGYLKSSLRSEFIAAAREEFAKLRVHGCPPWEMQ